MFRGGGKLAGILGFLKSNGAWFKAVLIISVLIRLYLAIFTQGTYDLDLWQRHMKEINRIGVIGHYNATSEETPPYNHPPVISAVAAAVFSLSESLHIPFKVFFRLLFTPVDFVIVFYLLKVLAANPYKYLLAAFYLLNPITFIFSAYHGNTDSILGLAVLMAVYYLSKKRYLAAGLILGAGSWVKWIVFLAAPPLFFAARGFKNKLRFALCGGLACLLGYALVLAREPAVLINNVFRYGGQLITTTAGIPVWGNRILCADFIGFYSRYFRYPAPDYFIGLLNYYLEHNNAIILAVVILYSWLRRHRRSGPEMGRTMGEVFCIFYGMANFWSFQHLAWSAPFLIFLNPILFVTISYFVSGYIYLLYSLVCGSYFLLGKWDFIAYPYLSKAVLFFRNMSILSFAGAAVWFFYSALSKNISVLLRRRRGLCPN